jgi:hypothetical protein
MKFTLYKSNNGFPGLFRRTFTSAEYHGIIGIPNKEMTSSDGKLYSADFDFFTILLHP